MLPAARRAAYCIIAFAALSITAVTQQAATPEVPTEKTAVVRFFSDVNPGSVGMLLQAVDGQFKNGTRKFILLMSSGGGDVLSGMMAYNYLKGLPIELTTFNVGNVDSSASIIYCAGTKRYAVPESRFIIHELSLTFTANGPGQINVDMPALEGQLAILKSQEYSWAKILSTAAGKPQTEAEAKIHAQASVSAVDANKWGLVQDIRTELFDPNNSTLVLATPPPPVTPNSPQSIPTVQQYSYTTGTSSSK